jgi:hypothetical protein
MLHISLKRLLVIGAATASCCGVLLLGASSLHAAQSVPLVPNNTVVSAVPPSSYAPGVPFMPLASAATTSSTASPALSGVSFTTDYVLQYLYAHLPFRTTSGAVPVVSSLRFMTSAQARATILGGDSTGRPDSDLVGVLELDGPFDASMFPHDPLATSLPAQYSQIMMVFDAQTGNLLEVGGQ